jgi:hypothetical protein
VVAINGGSELGVGLTVFAWLTVTICCYRLATHRRADPSNDLA